MRSAAGDDPDSGGTRTPASPTREESIGRLTRPRGILLAGEETGPTEEVQSVGDSQGKRRRLEGISVGKERAPEGGERMLTVEEVAFEGVGVGKKRAAEGGERVLTAEEAALATRPLPPREIPYPKSGDHNEVVAWMHASDALHHNKNIGDDDSLPTHRRRKVGDTKSVASAVSLDARNMILDVVCSVVNTERFYIPRASSLSMMTLVSVQLSKDTVVDARVIFFNGHYGISLFDVSPGFPLVPASLGSRPCYGQDVSVLYRNNKYGLVVSHGSIQCLENPFLERNHYMFPSCSTRLTCIGGPVINNNGEVIGLIVKHIPQAAIVSTSIVRKCIQMWNHFGRIAHPVHDLELKSVQMLDMVDRDELWVSHNIRSGFIVDQVCPYSSAEKIGLRRGDVIDLIDLDHRSTVVELEGFLLTLCWDLLEKKLDSASTIDIKIRVHDIRAKTRVCTIYPMEVSDATVRSYY
uniref:Uncharacterized protein n=1 Tax=Avena sativa TaxID=4498 RepID=A0ACD5TND2_AVESA